MLATFGYQYFLTFFVVKGTPPVQQAVQEIVQTHSSLKVCYILTAIFVASIYEEVLFRGILFPTIVRYLGLWSGITIVSGVFALIHMHVPSLVPLFLLSIALCVAYWRTGSLWINIGIHSIFNSVAIFNLLH
jgi:membrane protease YdiL (CAAX protease family)